MDNKNDAAEKAQLRAEILQARAENDALRRQIAEARLAQDPQHIARMAELARSQAAVRNFVNRRRDGVQDMEIEEPAPNAKPAGARQAKDPAPRDKSPNR